MPGVVPSKIFLNYRRADDAGSVQAVYAHLERFFDGDLFMDVEGQIAAGEDFVDALRGHLAACDVLLAFIGPRWLELMRNRDAGRSDYVVIEICEALAMIKMVIPVLVGGSAMPSLADLPEEIRRLATLQAIEVRPVSFTRDCRYLVETLHRRLSIGSGSRGTSITRPEATDTAKGPAEQQTPRRGLLVGLGALGGLGLLGGLSALWPTLKPIQRAEGSGIEKAQRPPTDPATHLEATEASALSRDPGSGSQFKTPSKASAAEPGLPSKAGPGFTAWLAREGGSGAGEPARVDGRPIEYPEPDELDPAPPWSVGAGLDYLGGFVDLDVDGVPARLRWVHPGRFLMGSRSSEVGHTAEEAPRHQVHCSKGCYFTDTPCTQLLWQRVMGSNPSIFKGDYRPVTNVSWDECQRFVLKLGERMPRMQVRLPTEAEWELACRGATTTATYLGELKRGRGRERRLDEIAWYAANSKGMLRPVGMKEPNGEGLYDMLGNVWEWCGDWYGPYRPGNLDAPTGPDSGPGRVIRGGSFRHAAASCRAAARTWASPNYRDDCIGFRFIVCMRS